MRNATFVYPDDRSLVGSCRLFVAFHSRMVKLERMAICAFTRTRSSKPVLVALLPQLEAKDDYGSQVRHLLRLPQRWPCVRGDGRAPSLLRQHVRDSLCCTLRRCIERCSPVAVVMQAQTQGTCMFLNKLAGGTSRLSDDIPALC